ncbi:uncharacterized protein LOC128962439 [Oppia nitens]|uniref:uncharacterized protein LOC128962439 n=1 Tax=Oppia nitens TaxID=1686743 RepID=UPI0023D9BF6B|nr:uncharacterized protein LOC128962439 [Oppia nitens]
MHIKFQNFIIITIWCLILAQLINASKCPKPELLKPCTCVEISSKPYLDCTADHNLNLPELFAKLSRELPREERYFENIHISGDKIVELPANMFADIKFHRVELKDCQNLRSIDRHVFNGTVDSIRSLSLIRLPLNESNDNTAVFDIINSLHSLQELYFESINLNTVPNNAFSKLDNLSLISFRRVSTNSIGKNVFKQLKSLRFLEFYEVNTLNISDNAFSFDETDVRLRFIIIFSAFNNSVISGQTFDGMLRPVTLIFLHNDKIQYISKDTFNRFIQQNPSHELIAHIDCNDCRNYWLLMISKQNNGIYCTNGRQLNDKRNFINC